MQRTVGISPKFFAASVTGLIGWLLSSFVIKGDPKVKYGLSAVASMVAAFLAPPGLVRTVAMDDSVDEDAGEIVAGWEMTHDGEAVPAAAPPAA
jgi:hypothetical protein